jgi:hypothetical protein
VCAWLFQTGYGAQTIALFKQFRGLAMIFIELKDGAEEFFRFSEVLKTELRLTAQIHSFDPVPQLKIVFKQEHRRQRGCKVVDLRYPALELVGTGMLAGRLRSFAGYEPSGTNLEGVSSAGTPELARAG